MFKKKVCHYFIIISMFVMFTGQSKVFSKETEGYAIETLTVTANKQEENVREVPISMSVFGSVELEDKNLRNVDDIAKYTPGLDIVNYGSALKYAPSIRGLYSDYSSRSSVAGLFVDGIPITDGTGFDEILMDIERVEVLKGPQGTLYGKNTEVGAINIITRKPDNNFRGKINTEFGDDDKREFSFSTSGPIIEEQLFIGLAGKHYEKDGFIENTVKGGVVDDSEHNYGKINLRWVPTDKFEANFIASKIKYDNEALKQGPTSMKDREVASDLAATSTPETTLSALNLFWRFNNSLNFSSITSHRCYKEINKNDFDYTSIPADKFHTYNDSKFETLSQEFRLNYTGSKVKLVSGIFLEKGEIDIKKERDTSRAFTRHYDETDSIGVGLFSHITYSLTDRLSLLGGLRYDQDEKEFKNPGSKDIDETWEELSPKFGITYDINSKMLTYLTISKGYRSGGFNGTPSNEYPTTYDEESLYSYEAGIKADFFDNRLILDTSLYYMDISDMQVDVYYMREMGGYGVYKGNAAEATSKGIEVAIRVKATDNLSMFAGVSINDAEYDKYRDAKGDYNGKTNPYSPEYDFNLGLNYRSVKGIYANIDLSGYGDMYLDRDNKFKRSAYKIVNSKIGYESENYEVYVYAQNLFDKEYDIDGMYGGYYRAYSDPREVGVQLVYRW